MSPQTATVEVLTAEVRVLMVGSRQITLSVFGQLDNVFYEGIELFGRVNAAPPKDERSSGFWVIGRDPDNGSLVRSWMFSPRSCRDWAPEARKSYGEEFYQARQLPLIVLAGLR